MAGLRALWDCVRSYLMEAAWEIGKGHCVYSPDDVTSTMVLYALRERN